MLGTNTPNHRMFAAAKAGNLDDLEATLRDGANIHATAQFDGGSTALHFACLKGHINIVRYLVQVAGANVNATISRGDTPLHIASAFNHIDIAQFLIDSGADKTKTNKNEKTALDLATNRNMRALLRLSPGKPSGCFSWVKLWQKGSHSKNSTQEGSRIKKGFAQSLQIENIAGNSIGR